VKNAEPGKDVLVDRALGDADDARKRRPAGAPHGVERRAGIRRGQRGHGVADHRHVATDPGAHLREHAADRPLIRRPRH
jgi:hypothetical protein